MNRKGLLNSLLLLCILESSIVGTWGYYQGVHKFYMWFFAPIIIYAYALYLNHKGKTTTAFYIGCSMVNFLMLMFDGGLLSFMKEFIYYIPIIISYYVFVPYENRKTRNLFITATISCLFICTFTDLTPKIKEQMYLATGYGPYIGAFNVTIALFATIFMLRYIIHSFKANEHAWITLNKKLYESEQKYDFALNVSLDGLWVWDVEKDQVWLSSKWKETLGYSEDELPNDSSLWETMIHPADKPRVLAALKDSLKGKGKIYESEYRIRCRDGNYKWITAKGKASEHTDEGYVRKMTGTHKDITELKLSQQQLRNNELLLDSINQNITEAIYRSTPSDGIIYYNRAFSKMFQMDDYAIKNTPSILFYVDKEERSRLINIINEKGFFSNEEVLFKRADGSYFWGLESSYRAVDEFGNVFYDGAIRDITEIKAFEADLVLAKEEAEEASKAKSNFLSIMSHEMRTPLNAILGFTELLENTDLTKEQEGYIGLLRFSGDNLVKLINDILDASRIEAGKLELDKYDFNLSELLDNISSNFEAQSARKGIRFKSNINLMGYTRFVSDPHRITQILSNLLSNAIKFTDAGEVRLEVLCKGGSHGKVMLSFSVTDSGVGIADNQLNKIFEPFAQATNATARKYGGSGLGLSITRSLLQLFGSDIQVKSTVGSGSKFYFTVSLECSDFKVTHPVMQQHDENQKNELKGLRILAVDDNEINLTLLSNMLKQFEVTVELASSGREAIQKTLIREYDLVIMDIHMPGMDGIETTRKIKEINSLLPVVALSADTQEVCRENAMNVGMKDFILKPITSAGLKNMLLRVLSHEFAG